MDYFLLAILMTFWGFDSMAKYGIYERRNLLISQVFREHWQAWWVFSKGVENPSKKQKLNKEEFKMEKDR
jgi:hypothetical protein